jgi:hypothetical protein
LELALNTSSNLNLSDKTIQKELERKIAKLVLSENDDNKKHIKVFTTDDEIDIKLV